MVGSMVCRAEFSRELLRVILLTAPRSPALHAPPWPVVQQQRVRRHDIRIHFVDVRCVLLCTSSPCLRARRFRGLSLIASRWLRWVPCFAVETRMPVIHLGQPRTCDCRRRDVESRRCEVLARRGMLAAVTSVSVDATPPGTYGIGSTKDIVVRHAPTLRGRGSHLLGSRTRRARCSRSLLADLHGASLAAQHIPCPHGDIRFGERYFGTHVPLCDSPLRFPSSCPLSSCTTC